MRTLVTSYNFQEISKTIFSQLLHHEQHDFLIIQHETCFPFTSNKVPFLPETPMKQEPNKGHVLNGHHLALKMAIAPCCFLYYSTIVS